MLKLKVKSLWQGQVGVHQKYVAMAWETGQDIRFRYNEETMTIPKNEIKGAIKGISAEKFMDRYKAELYHLVYFDWKPDGTIQGKLL